MKLNSEPFKFFWMSVYLRILACFYLLGASIHVGNFLGFGGGPWHAMPLSWQIVDVVYSTLDIGVAVGLWLRRFWGVALFMTAAISQLILYGVFPQWFAFNQQHLNALSDMVIFHGSTLLIFFALGVFKK